MYEFSGYVTKMSLRIVCFAMVMSVSPMTEKNGSESARSCRLPLLLQ